MDERGLRSRLGAAVNSFRSSELGQDMTKTTKEALDVFVPKPAEVGIALIVASLGTAGYFLTSELPNREAIPLITVLAGATILVGRRALHSISRRNR